MSVRRDQQVFLRNRDEQARGATRRARPIPIHPHTSTERPGSDRPPLRDPSKGFPRGPLQHGRARNRDANRTRLARQTCARCERWLRPESHLRVCARPRVGVPQGDQIWFITRCQLLDTAECGSWVANLVAESCSSVQKSVASNSFVTFPVINTHRFRP